MRKILIRILIVVLITAIALSVYILFDKTKEKKTPEQVEQNVKEIENEFIEEPEQEPIIDYGYLKVGQWGVASKYSSKSEQYEDVNITIKNFTRGEDAESIIKKYIKQNKHFEYTKPEQDMEWLVVEYKINFGDFKKGRNGANSDIQTRIKGYGENEDIIVDNIIYKTATQDISTREYTKEDTIIGRFVTQIPKKCEQYVIVFGNQDYNYCEFEVVPKENKIIEQNEGNIETVQDNTQNQIIVNGL